MCIISMIFDIGANVGRWALANLAAADARDGIVCVEPDPDTHTALCRALSGHPTVRCINAAVCDNGGEPVTFYKCEDDCCLSTLNVDWLASEASRFHGRPHRAITCPSVTLDALIDRFGLPELVKIDVEGAEDRVLASLSREVPLLCFEWASELNSATFTCLDRLTALGFARFHVQYTDGPYDFRPTSFPCSAADVRALLAKTTPKREWGMIWAAHF